MCIRGPQRNEKDEKCVGLSRKSLKVIEIRKISAKGADERQTKADTAPEMAKGSSRAKVGAELGKVCEAGQSQPVKRQGEQIVTGCRMRSVGMGSSVPAELQDEFNECVVYEWQQVVEEG